MRKRGLAPIIDGRIETLVLGSFPSVASLARQEYYAHPQNHFWKIMAALAGRPLDGMAYADRMQTVLGLHIGIWDVVAACEREEDCGNEMRAFQFGHWSALYWFGDLYFEKRRSRQATNMAGDCVRIEAACKGED